jgi:prepilin-type processing-associated H-X9-DG protein
MAMIAILAGLFAPALVRAQRSARQVRCASNLRQLGIAGQMYWDDNAGQAFRWRGAATNGGQIYWFGWLQDGAEGERQFDPTPGALYPYVRSGGVEVCPAFNYSHPQFKSKAIAAAYGYGYNFNLSAPADRPPVSLSKVTRPSELVFLADAAQVNTFQAPASPEHPMLEEFYYINTTEPTVHFRHQHRANAVFCDGHVSTQRPLPGSLDQRLPKEEVGQLAPELLRLE